MFRLGGCRVGVVMFGEGGEGWEKGREIKIRITIKIKIYGGAKARWGAPIRNEELGEAPDYWL